MTPRNQTVDSQCEKSLSLYGLDSSSVFPLSRTNVEHVGKRKMPNARLERDQLVAAIFNKLAGPNAPPVHDYDELQAEAFDTDELEEWKHVEAALGDLPPCVVQGLLGLLADWQDRNNHGRRRALILAASVAKRRGQTGIARDLLLVAGIPDNAALQSSGADDRAIRECESLFDDWKPTERDCGEAQVRCFPIRMEGMFHIDRGNAALAD
jgi:hypothetical protein